jgi:hypothetical protein
MKFVAKKYDFSFFDFLKFSQKTEIFSFATRKAAVDMSKLAKINPNGPGNRGCAFHLGSRRSRINFASKLEPNLRHFAPTPKTSMAKTHFYVVSSRANTEQSSQFFTKNQLGRHTALCETAELQLLVI